MALGTADLPCPEEPVLQGVHACQLEVEESILHLIRPVAGIIERRAVAAVLRTVSDTPNEQTAVVDSVTKLARNRDTEVLSAAMRDMSLTLICW